jgi:DNA-binding MarR family transcriptional regulator
MCRDLGQFQTADLFLSVGHIRKGYELIDHWEYSKDVDGFAETKEATKADILAVIKKNPLATSADIAKALNVKPEWVARNIAEMVKGGAILQTTTADAIERTVTPGADDILKRLPPPKETEIILRYSYQKRPIAEGRAIISTSRPFCRKMMEFSSEGRVFSRQDIESLSAQLGYSVFERNGGFWFHDGKADIQCRHYWRTEILLKKSQ